MLTLGSNGAIRESVQVGLGITLISRDAVAQELEEQREADLPRQRAWHVVARADEHLPATAGPSLPTWPAAVTTGSPWSAPR